MTRPALATATLFVVVGVLALTAGCADSSGGTESRPGPTAGGETSGSSAPGSASTSPTGDPGPVVACPKRARLDPDPALPDEVPAGATSVRLCDAGAESVTPPLDALTSDVVSVAEEVNGQRLVRRACTDRRLPEYQLAFGYPDGTSFVVAGRFTGCAELLVGSARRHRAAPPLRAFVDGLRAQRATTTPPADAADLAGLDCAQPPSRLPTSVARPTELAVAVLCFAPQQFRGAPRVEIAPADLATLVASMATDTASSAGDLGCGSPSPAQRYWIVGSSTWGDPIVMRRGCFGLTIEGDLEWTPRGAARTILKGLVADAR